MIIIIITTFMIIITIMIIIIIIMINMEALPGTYLELLSAVSHPTPTSSPETSDVRLKRQVIMIIIPLIMMIMMPMIMMIMMPMMIMMISEPPHD